jgi:predicted enzyme related to lactoylglutathione lyase
MSTRPIQKISHVGICVSDMARSVRFYSQALGFAVLRSGSGGAPFDILAELPGMSLNVTVLERDGLNVELLEYPATGTVGSSQRRPINQLGISHMAFAVDDIDQARELISRFGGHVLDHTRIAPREGEFIYCTDPDGVRLELWKKPDQTQPS